MKCIKCVRNSRRAVRPFITAHIKFCKKCNCDTGHCFIKDSVKGF